MLLEDQVDLACDVTFEAADHLLFCPALGRAPFHVLPGAWIVSEPHDNDLMECGIGPAIASPVEPVAVCLARGSGDGIDPAQRGKGSLASQAFGIVPGGYQKRGRYVRSDAEGLEQGRSCFSCERCDLGVEGRDLGTEVVMTPGDGPDGKLCGCRGRLRAGDRRSDARA